MIRERRRELRLSQEDLSYDAGFARAYLSDVERGARSFSIKTLSKLANSLSIQPSALIRMAEERLHSEDERPGLASDLTQITALLCSSDRGLIMTNPVLPDNPILFASRGFFALTGYTAAEVIGRNCRFLQPENRDQAETKKLKDAVENRAACTVIMDNCRKDGSIFANEITIEPIYDDSGTFCMFLGLQRQVENHILGNNDFSKSQTQETFSPAQSQNSMRKSKHTK